jgi:ABC-type sugar transport system ATPase subunit
MLVSSARAAPKEEQATVAHVLSVKGVSKRFGHIQALNDVSLDLDVGEIRAICGENGAGKSTLVKILTGLFKPDTGTISIDGKPCHIHNPRDAQQLGVNLVAQELSICPDISVLDNIWLGTIGVPFLHRKPDFRRRARESLERLGAGHIDIDAPARSLNTGERQIVEIARMMTRDTRILILDEPTATLSDQEIERIMAALKAVREQGRSVLYITHRLGEVFEICDSASIMRNGELVASESVANLDRKTLIELMLGRSFEEMYPEHHTMQGEPVLSLRDLTVPGQVRDIHLDVPRGQIVCLTGQVGSGVESVVRAIAGLECHASGHIFVNGQRLPLGSSSKARQLGVRFVSGDRAEEGVFVALSVAENLIVTRCVPEASLDFCRARSSQGSRGACPTVGVDARRLGSEAGDLSGGNQQKLAFGRCLNDGDPGVIVMLEPTRGIDVGARAEIYKMMREFCDAGFGLLVASTDFAEVLGLGDVVVTMFRGAFVRTYKAADISMPQLIADVTHPEH